jgi:CelD/BcsL family acetyltransferase involved in cellulose biosynthesis
LSVCKFDHLLAKQTPNYGQFETAPSPWIDVRDGYESYISRQRAGDSTLIAQTLRKQRKLLREAERAVFQWHDEDLAALDCLWKWKSAQRQATGTMDILQFNWVRTFLTRMTQANQSGLRGVVSTLRINGEIAAVHLGMHTATTFHYWFPAYSVVHGSCSPGLILLLNVVEECARRGITTIDLGKGEDRYKSAFASGVTNVATGAVDRNPVRQLWRASLRSTKQWVKNSPLRSAAKWPVRWWRHWQTQSSMGTTSQ